MRWFLSRDTAETTETGESKPNVRTRLSGDLSSPADALRHFEYPGVPPPSARVGDPKLKQRESEPVRLWHLWKYGTFAAVKGECPWSSIGVCGHATDRWCVVQASGVDRQSFLMATPREARVRRGQTVG